MCRKALFVAYDVIIKKHGEKTNNEQQKVYEHTYFTDNIFTDKMN